MFEINVVHGRMDAEHEDGFASQLFGNLRRPGPWMDDFPVCGALLKLFLQNTCYGQDQTD